MIPKWEFDDSGQLYKKLSTYDVDYWKRAFRQTIKVGSELEFNLPDKKTGICKGNSQVCVCKHYKKENYTCWTKCANTSMCFEQTMENCIASTSSSCTADKCKTCTKFVPKCDNKCSNFIPKCITCNEFTIDCSSCNYLFDPTKNPDAIRESCKSELTPSGSYGSLSPSGVHSIVTDGSLLGNKGMEVITTGRRPDYWEFYTMYKNILDSAITRGAYINERCSIHMHILCAYYSKLNGTSSSGSSSQKISELERSVPSIIMANFHQLVRCYQNAITWMTTGLSDPNHLTRWEKFRISVLPVSAETQHMRDVQQQVSEIAGGNKYSFVNYRFLEFDKNGDVSRLHTEIRVMDALQSPSAIAALSCLYYSLFIKATELSRYGVIKLNDHWLNKAKEIKNALMNNTTSWEEGTANGRVSDTSNLKKFIPELVSESLTMLSQLKPILNTFGNVFDVLEKLAEMPCSLRLYEGKTWDQIEEDIKISVSIEDSLNYHLTRFIDLNMITKKANIDSWVSDAAVELKNVADFAAQSTTSIYESVELAIRMRLDAGKIVWSNKLGTIITNS